MCLVGTAFSYIISYLSELLPGSLLNTKLDDKGGSVQTVSGLASSAIELEPICLDKVILQ